MKRVIQIVLSLFIVIIFIIFYKVYFNKNTEIQSKLIETQEQSLEKSENNLIKNLKYEINLDENKKYIITAELSEIAFEKNFKLADGIEVFIGEGQVVNMQKVFAVFVNETNIPLTVTSGKAKYNNVDYNTNFSENVQVEYLDNLIFSDRMELDFSKNIISIYDNVQYEGLYGNVKADNVRINLITKKIEIYMNNSKKKVEVTTKE